MALCRNKPRDPRHPPTELNAYAPLETLSRKSLWQRARLPGSAGVLAGRAGEKEPAGRRRSQEKSWNALRLLPPRPDLPHLLLGARTGRFEKGGERPGRADERLDEVETFREARLPAVEPAGDLGTLLAVHAEQGVAVRRLAVLEMEAGLAVEGGKKDGEEQRQLLVPHDRDRPVAGREVLPLPQDGHGAGLARDRLDLPRTGELRLRGGARLVLLAQAGQVGGGEGVVEGGNGRTGTMVRAAHEVNSPAWSRGRAELVALSGLACFYERRVLSIWEE